MMNRASSSAHSGHYTGDLGRSRRSIFRGASLDLRRGGVVAILGLVAAARGLAADYVDRTVLLLATGQTSIGLVNSGTGTDTYTVRFGNNPATQRIKFWAAINNVPTHGSAQDCDSTPCLTIAMNRNYGQQYGWYEIVDLAGASLSPAKPSSRLVFPEVEVPASAPGAWTVPIEAVGQDMYATHRQFTNSAVVTGLQLYLRAYNLGYTTQNPSYPTQNVSDGKCSVQVNGGTWTELADANVTRIDEQKHQGGIGTFPQVLDLTLPISDGVVIAGTNSVGFRMNLTDGIGSGCRFLAAAFIEPSKTITSIVVASNVATVLTSSAHGYSTGDWVLVYLASGGVRARFNDARQITVTDSTHFTFSTCRVSMNILAGACTAPNGTYAVPVSQYPSTGLTNLAQPVAYVARMSTGAPPAEEDPSTWTAPGGSSVVNGNTYLTTGTLVIPSSPYFGYATSAKCIDCHTRFGGTMWDLNYFKYSPWVIRQRVLFHGGTKQQADDAIAKVLSLSTGSPAHARPWNALHQPAPGLDSGTAAAWTAGGGVDSTVTYGVNVGEYAAPAGSFTAWRGAASPALNLREIPSQYQYPVWNQLLPAIYPGDFFTAGSGLTAFAGSALLTYFVNARAAITAGNVSTYAAYDTYMALALTTMVTYTDAVNLLRNKFAWAGNIRPSLYTTALQSIKQWAVVQHLDIVQGGGFLDQGSVIFTALHGASPGRPYDTRVFYSGIPFYVGAHIGGISQNGYLQDTEYSTIPSAGGNSQSYTQGSNSNYLWQTTVNNGNGWQAGNGFVDWPYDFLYANPPAYNRPADYATAILSAAAIQSQWFNTGITGNEYFVALPNAQNFIGVLGPPATGFMTAAQLTGIGTATAQLWIDMLAHWADWVSGSGACTAPANGVNTISLSMCDGIAGAIPMLKAMGVDETLLTALADAAQAYWAAGGSNPNFRNQLAAPCSLATVPGYGAVPNPPKYWNCVYQSAE